MAPLPAARKDHWKVVFQNAWDVVKEDVDRGGKTANDESEAKDAIFCLDNEMEGFVLAVREDDLDTQSDKELLDLFCQLAHHRNTTPLVKDWVKILRDDYDRGRDAATGPSCLRALLPRLPKPQILPAELGLFPSILEQLPNNIGWVPGQRLRAVLTYLTYLERDAWRVGDAPIPEAEKRLLSQRILNDIQYVEQQAFDITRKPGDQFYIDAGTAAEERLQRLCGRTIEMWVKGYGGGPEKDSAPQPRRRGQWRPADELRETPRPAKTPFLLGWHRRVLRVTAGYVAESRICQILLKHYPRRFIRSLEQASADGAPLLDDFFDYAQGSLERHSPLETVPECAPPFFPVEVKHAVTHPHHVNERGSQSQLSVWISDRSEKDNRRGIVILTSATDPDRVAICLANALLQNVDEVGKDVVHVSEVDTLSGQTCPPAFASHVKPYEISISEIPEMLSLLLKCARDGTKAWRNPATNVRFDRWGLVTSKNRNLLLDHGQAERWVRWMETRFRKSDTGYRFRTNALAPLLGDGHFYNTRNERQHFLEIKAEHLRVSGLDVRHSVALMGNPAAPTRPSFDS